MSIPRTESQVVSFRLEAEQWEQLVGRAQGLHVSTHALARFFVIEALAASTQIADLGAAFQELHSQIHEFVAGVQNLQGEIKGQRADLALGVQALLASAGKYSAKEAKVWTEQSLNRRIPCSPSPAP